MIRPDLSPIANHLWQSTLCVAAVWLLTLALRRNRAGLRYGLWLAASLKFLIPFSLLVSAGAQWEWRRAPAIAPPQFSMVLDQIGRPFSVSPSAAPPPAAPPASSPLPPILFGVWLSGVAVAAFSWLRWWRSIRAAQRAGSPLDLHLPIPAISTPVPMEPGVFGIREPVLLLPDGIAARLTPAQLQTVIAHELCHVRRRDNLTAAVHLVVETLFWFHPLLWWIRARLAEERERACDEEVVAAAGDPGTYAEGILNVCRFFLESPPCMAGVTGANLRKRIENIVACRRTSRLDKRRKFLLAAVGLAAVAGPVAIGMLYAPSVGAQPANQPPLAFEVASVKPNHPGDSLRAPSMILPGGRFTATNNTVRGLILNAYGISASPYLLSGGPAWIDSERYDIDAKAAGGEIPAGASNRILWEKTRLMLRTLLADRFQLALRREAKEMPLYELAVAKNGPKLQKSEADCQASLTACHGFSGNPTHLSGAGVDMYDLALILGNYSDRPVVDKTGISGIFDVKLQWNPFAGGAPPADDTTPRKPGAESREGPRPDFSSLPTLFTALEQQVGLKLESKKGPVDIYVIEHVERPSGN